MKPCPLLNQSPRHEETWRSGGMAPHILNLGTRWKQVVSLTPPPPPPAVSLTPEKETSVAIGD